MLICLSGVMGNTHSISSEVGARHEAGREEESGKTWEADDSALVKFLSHLGC